MADDINKKISIDVEVKTDGQQQINQYKASFDNLRTSINSLNKPLTDLSNNISSLDKDISGFTDILSKLNTQNQAASASGNKLKDTFKDLTGTFSTWKSIISSAEVVTEGWAGALAAGLTILTNYGPAILDWVSSMLKGNSTLTALNKTIKDNKIIMEAIGKAKQQGDADAQKELINLKLLFAAAQDHNLSLKQRKTVIAQLREQYPGYLNDISDEAIMNGKATKSYTDLANSIIAASRARAAEDIMTKNQQRQLGNEDKLAGLSNQAKELNKQLKIAEEEYSKITANPVIGGSTLTPGLDSREADGYNKVAKLKDDIADIQAQISHLNTDSNLLSRQNQQLVKSVIKSTEQYGIQVLGISQKTNTEQNKLSGIAVKNQKSIVSEQNKAYASEALAANQHYADEKQKLDKALKDKLISLGEYYKKAEALQNDYHASIGDVINKVNSDQSRGPALPDAKGTTQVDDATLKSNQLDLTNVTTHEQQITKIKTDAEKVRGKMETDAAQQVANTTFSIISKGIQAQSDAKVRALETEKDKELNNSSLTSAQRLAIEAKYRKQEGAIKAKAFKEEQEASIAQAVINGAIAITKAESELGPIAGTIAVAAVIANTALQVATIAKQKPPAYAKGGLHYQSDGRGGMLPGYSRTDNTNAYLRSGEGIVVSEAMQVPWARNLVSAINVGFGGRDFSAPINTRGFAVGGIFTDGGNTNRYYNQPVNDQKNLANTVAYQMINNFPPVYVDVKDINNQQNILAQTVNRVNL